MHESQALASLRTFQEYHWIMLRCFYDVSYSRFGADGVSALRRGIRQHGYNRGLAIRDAPESHVRGRSGESLIDHWDTAEWDLAEIDGQLEYSGTPESFAIDLANPPGHEYFQQAGNIEPLRIYWEELVHGIALGYDTRTSAELVTTSSGHWRMNLTFRGAGSSRAASLSLGRSISDDLSMLSKTRSVAGQLAGLQMYVSREICRDFDADGEDAVRSAAYEFGAVRGRQIRRNHESKGKALTLANFAAVDGLQERDESEAVFVFSSKQHISDGAYFLDCTYCPLAEVWSREGAEGLRLGYLFDAADHRGLFQSYNPEIMVRWDSLKSRGDRICKFRFTIPSLLTEDDPSPESFDSWDSG